MVMALLEQCKTTPERMIQEPCRYLQICAAVARGHAGKVRQQRLRGALRPAARVDAQDRLARLHVGQREQQLPVEAARSPQRRVQRVGAVRGADHNDLPGDRGVDFQRFECSTHSSLKCMACRLLRCLLHFVPTRRRALHSAVLSWMTGEADV